MKKHFLGLVIVFFFIACSTNDESENQVSSVAITEIIEVGSTSATISVSVQGSDILEKGVVWNTSANPTLENSESINNNSSSTENFDVTIPHLTPENQYFVRGYITTNETTLYSLEESFFTIELCDSGNIFQGNIELTSQTDVNNFGANGYCEISGGLYIHESSTSDPIVDLTPLSSLRKVSDLYVRYCNLLESLEGLNNIVAPVDILLIGYNTELKNLNALSGLTSTNETVQISANPSLVNFDGLENLHSIGANLNIINNDALVNINGLRNVTSIKSAIYIEGNETLKNIDGLVGFTGIADPFAGLSILNNPSLLNVNGASNITNLGSNLEISVNGKLENLDGFSSLIALNGRLKITTNGVLTDFCGLTNLLQNGQLGGAYIVSYNAYNPTEQDIIDGNCSI